MRTVSGSTPRPAETRVLGFPAPERAPGHRGHARSARTRARAARRAVAPAAAESHRGKTPDARDPGSGAVPVRCRTDSYHSARWDFPSHSASRHVRRASGSGTDAVRPGHRSAPRRRGRAARRIAGAAPRRALPSAPERERCVLRRFAGSIPDRRAGADDHGPRGPAPRGRRAGARGHRATERGESASRGDSATPAITGRGGRKSTRRARDSYRPDGQVLRQYYDSRFDGSRRPGRPRSRFALDSPGSPRVRAVRALPCIARAAGEGAQSAGSAARLRVWPRGLRPARTQSAQHQVRQLLAHGRAAPMVALDVGHRRVAIARSSPSSGRSSRPRSSSSPTIFVVVSSRIWRP